ncbi:putative lipid II flippase FtsW [Candidatus Bipolaricaulota sp. J31]
MGKIEGRLLLVTVALLVAGLIFVYSASFPLALRLTGEETGYLKRQLMGCLLGTLMLIGFWFGDYWFWTRLSPILLLGTLGGLVLTLLPGIGVGGRWLSFGPISLQPSEFGKIALLLFLARSLAEEDLLEDFRKGVLPYLALLGAFGIFLLLQPDFGMFLLYSALTFFMLWVAGVRTRHLLGAAALGLPVLGGALVLAPYRLGRILAFLNPESFRHSYGYQVYQSLLALGSGGIFGRGLGASRAKLFYLPSAHNDFIFAVVGEEAGLLGALALIILLAALVALGYWVSRDARDDLGALLALGASFILGFQALLNLGVVVGVFPVTGLTLPFISYGGSSLAVSMGLVGILLGVAREAEI